MAVQLPSQQELYDLFIDAAQDAAPELTDTNEGSIIDSIAGAFSLGGDELARIISEYFAKTFFRTSFGPEVNTVSGADDLEALAVDHFGDRFARPEATKAVGVVTFSRPTAAFGNVPIIVGTIVKTPPGANGQAQRFTVTSAVTLVGLSINASVEAVTAGTEGNVQPNTVTVIESSLLDSSVVVTNALAFSGGAAVQDDATYLETIKDLIETLRGATKTAIEATARTVAGVVTATAIENMIAVRKWDIGADAPVLAEPYFWIPEPILYIADVNGTASAPLIAAVVEAIRSVRALGVKIDVQGGTPLELDWSAQITLNPLGPSFAELSSDPARIIATMEDYLNDLPIGTGFSRAAANAAIFAIWGPAGTNDLTAFSTSIPAGDVAAGATTKIIPGTVAII